MLPPVETTGVFTASTYVNFVTESTAARERLFLTYIGPRDDFDIIVVGSGVGGGVLADDLAERLGTEKRILVVEAGSYLYPTHVYNLCRFPNASLAQHFGCDTFHQGGNPATEFYIGEKPQLNLGGRSIFWSGLIPSVQGWELDFYPPTVRQDLASGLLNRAGETMNESHSLGSTAHALVTRLRQSSLAQDFSIQETPARCTSPTSHRTALRRTSSSPNPPVCSTRPSCWSISWDSHPAQPRRRSRACSSLLNHYVEDVQNRGGHFGALSPAHPDGRGSHSHRTHGRARRRLHREPEAARRSSLFPSLPGHARALVGHGPLPTTRRSNEATTFVDEPAATCLSRTALTRRSSSTPRGLRENGETRYPFNVEMNVNHEYWHLRENDPTDDGAPIRRSATRSVARRHQVQLRQLPRRRQRGQAGPAVRVRARDRLPEPELDGPPAGIRASRRWRAGTAASTRSGRS